ncbi:MAG: dihydropteroate synthase [Anaerolineae bacterium]
MNVVKGSEGTLSIDGKVFAWGQRTYVMGILNITPDSFSGDGLAGDFEAALAQAQRFAAEGVDIIDVGGESTRPGSTPVSTEEELGRVIPIISHLAREFDLPISIDTYKADVARQALQAGAHLINDVWGLRRESQLASVAAEYDVPLILMHNRSTSRESAQVDQLGGHFVGVEYEDLVPDIIRELRTSIEIALDAGVQEEKIIVDPGLGFGKTVEQSLEIVRRLAEFKILGRPILVGPSRKSFIGRTLNLPVNQRLEGTAATVAISIANGADMVRVHDVKEMVRVARMTDALVR